MTWTIEDLTGSASWLDARDPVAALQTWTENQRPDIRAGVLTRGISSMAGVVAANRAAVRALAATDWRTRIEEGLERARGLLGTDLPDVSVIVLIGSGHSNASAEAANGRPQIFVWLESWLGPTAPDRLQGHTISDLSIWTCHELAHALRFTGGSPRITRALADRTRAATTRLSFTERAFEEGLATRFSAELFAEASPARVLGMPQLALDWLEKNRSALLIRAQTFELDESDAARRAFMWSPPETRTSWSLADPPYRWGYFVGSEWMAAVRAANSWNALLRPPGVDLPS